MLNYTPLKAAYFALISFPWHLLSATAGHGEMDQQNLWS